LHLGHYFGALQNWLSLAAAGQHRCSFFSADWHALTTGYRDTANLAAYRQDMVADWLAVGLDPAKVTLFSQAAITEHAELATLFGMITPVPWLERVPSYKEIRQELADRDLSTIGFLGYPLLQTADIAIYLGTHVPVGEDQLAHLELSREVIRRFNSYYAEILPEPAGLVTKVRRLPGLDGRKMSKSYNNAIFLTESAEDVKKKVMPAPTDPARVKRTDPGDPDKCNIFAYHKLFATADEEAEIAQGCRTAGIGCVDCKRRLLGKIEAFQAPIRDRKAEIMRQGTVQQVLTQGNAHARSEAQRTMQQVREAMAL